MSQIEPSKGLHEKSRGCRYLIGGQSLAAPALPAALHLVATPIGNLSDITIRALEVLAAADIIACEDTRTSRVLLQRYGITGKLVAYHEHNAASAGPRLIEAIGDGQSVALISDAGTPLLSDPGYRLVDEAVQAGITVVPIPGPSAALAALTASGLPTDAFFFAGFLPPKLKARADRLVELREIPGSLVFYESPRRLPESLAAMSQALGKTRKACVGRELTKAFEEFRRGTLAELAAHYEEAGAPKGECVVCVGPPLPEAAIEGEALDELLRELAEALPTGKAAAEAARRTGRAKNDLYRRIVEMKNRDG
ncbi:16S rRNA (cytidine(1402)-2'-O)-methyltransferase [Notoacmeibacter sp. MSK16QG-6]|uniref:16S rRNA (cytidine(1402)-2'-O)-methyltransferase n=1 Tax=Notoacmeibacter sp. MSK16QG-6 TaxID=2957982 RepID=UPI0020A1070A|nr:16S rRNA (cytidine(1402)-2'-O)-methyltransferase [Notoacmeibacter sp. MSK16QG-6]MCP1198904.1 16S rRNA (cytidine(1402)-2'-O)-methyltransferase [Notoacmeibacter sp. MSK16QG-6]